MLQRPVAALAIVVLVAACASDGPGATTRPGSSPAPESTAPSSASPTNDSDAAPTDPTGGSADTAAGDAATVSALADAVSINVADGPDGPIVVWTTHDGVFGAGFDTDTAELGPTWRVPGDVAPYAHPIERPAVAVDADGRIHVAYTAPDVDGGSGGSVAYAVRDGEAMTPPEVISGPPRAETVLVHITDDLTGQPALAWLEDSTLSVAVPGSGATGWTEHEAVDDQTCDCCNPVPLLLGDDVIVAYRDLERTDTDVIRDVAMTRSIDGGQTFSEHVVIADDHWFLDACPFSGPDVVEADGALVVAWMDGRQSVHPDQDATTIWVDRSTDSGRTFGQDVALTTDGIHRWPVMAVDGDGVVHLVWETQSADEGGITYTSSRDGGVMFAPPRLLVAGTPETGLLRTPSIAVSGDVLVMTWITSTSGARVASFPIDEMISTSG